MEQLSARELRHNLRTPINHVLGYAEMLLEEARTGKHADCLAHLEDIRTASREALAHVNAALAAGDITHEGFQRLCDSLRDPVHRIVAATESVGFAAPEWSPDLARIQTAAEALLAVEGVPGEAPCQPAEEAASAPSRNVQARLLVVDDNETNRHMLRRQLEPQGYRIDEASDGGGALERLRRERFELVLLDIMMPGIDGFQVLAEIKRDPALRDVPVIVVSAVDELKSVVRSIEMGAEDYLLKPFDPVLLRARVGASLEKQRLRSELLVQERLASLGALAAGVAHEIRNPLNFVTNFAGLSVELIRELREKLESLNGRTSGELLEIAADLEQNVLKIKEHGARADSVVESMLRHSRGQSGERRPTDVNALVAEAINLAYHGLRAQDTTFNAIIETAYDPAVGTIDIIPRDINRVVLNIACNAFYAVKHRPSPRVRVETRNAGANVEIRVSDNGTGIAPEIRGRIFEPFFTTKPPGQGTGLGLSLSQDIVVNEHKGEIRVESQPGYGAEFIVVLPREAA